MKVPCSVNDNDVSNSSLYNIIDIGEHKSAVSYRPGMRITSVALHQHLFVNREMVDEFKSSYFNHEVFVSQLFQHWLTFPRFDERKICFDTVVILKCKVISDQKN